MNNSNIPSPQNFLLKVPMYLVIHYQRGEVWKILDLIYFEGTYDCFCTKCGKDSTFRVLSKTRPPEFNIKMHALLEPGGTGSYTPPQIPPNIYQIVAHCSRDESHLQYHLFLADTTIETDGSKKQVFQYSIQKIGQHPSYGDLNLPKLKKYVSVLSKTQLGELNRAIGLASHDVGIGAYVYLRRVFEALVEEAHLIGKHDIDWDEDAYSRSRMSDKIVLLKDHMPTFLVEHPQIYSLLSKGVHELSEDDCLAHFETLRIGIELILDEKLERKEKKKKIRDAEAALTKAIGDTKA